MGGDFSTTDAERLARLEVKADYNSRDLESIKEMMTITVETSRNQAFSLGALEKVVNGLIEKAAKHDDNCENMHKETTSRLTVLETAQSENAKLHEEVGSLKKEIEMLKEEKTQRLAHIKIVKWLFEHPMVVISAAAVIIFLASVIAPSLVPIVK